MIEHRLAQEFRVSGSGRVLTGAVMVFGDISPDYSERFEPGALAHSGRIDINLQHDPAIVLVRDALLTDSPSELRVRAELPPDSAALALVKRSALNSWSIEFKAQSERREGGVRIVSRADLTGLALCDRGSYPEAKVEIRRGRRGDSKTSRLRALRVLRARIPYDESLACECLKKGGGAACIPKARFSKLAGDSMAEVVNSALAEARDVLGVLGEFKRPIASGSRGTLRAVSTDDALELEMDLPDGEIGDAVLSAHEAAGIVVRPLIDFDRSEFTDTDRGREYTKPWVRAFLVGATDTKGGWPVPSISEAEGPPPTTAEKIAALAKISKRRARVWL